jgi:SAM-dependent methyltransferase
VTASEDVGADTRPRVFQEIDALLAERFRRGAWTPRRVLEAGGGRVAHFWLPREARLVVLDLSAAQLRGHPVADDRIQADLHRLPLSCECVDLVVCFNVLEHLEDPGRALGHLARVLRGGGLLLIGAPERTSLKGILTRLTPVRVHRAFYRYVVGKADTGEGHYDAFETPFRPLVSLGPLASRLRREGLQVEWSRRYDGAAAFHITAGDWWRRLASLPYYAIASLGWLISLGRWPAVASDFLILARRDPGAAAAASGGPP